MKQKIPKSKIQRRLRASVAFAVLVCFASLFQTHNADAQMYGFTPDPQLGCTVSGSYVNSDPLNYRARMHNHWFPNGEQSGQIRLELRRGTGLPTSLDGSGVIRVMRVRSGLELVQDIPYSPGCNTSYTDQLYITNTNMLPQPGQTEKYAFLAYRTHDCNGNATGVQVGGIGYNFMGYYVVNNNMSMNIITPTQETVGYTNNTLSLEWQTNAVDRVDIDLYKAGQYVRRIATNVTTMYYYWSVPTDLYTGDDYQIRVTNSAYGILNRTSSMFRINGLAVPTPVALLAHQETTVIPSALVYNQTGTINTTVRNTGNASFNKNVYISLYSIAANTTTVLKTYSGGIPAGQTVNITDARIYTYPVGTYTILVACDKEEGNGLRELYRQNVSIQQPVQNSYDLKVNSLSVSPEVFEKGQPGGFASSVTNTGTKPVQVYMSWHKADGTYITDLVAGTLLAGKTQMLSKLNYKIISDPGTYRVVMKYYNPDTRQYVHVQEKEVRVLASKVLVPAPPMTIVQGVDEYLFGYLNFQEGIDPKTLRIIAVVTFQDNSSTNVPVVLENGGAVVELEGESNELLDKSLTSKFSLKVPAVAWSKKTMRMATFQIMNRYNQIFRFVSNSTPIVIKKLSEITKECGDKYGIPPELLTGICNVERKSTSKLEGAVGPMNTMVELLVDGGLDEVAIALRDGSTSFTGWPEYQGLTLDKMKELIRTDALTGIRAAAWSLRYVAHRMFPEEMHYNLLKNNQQNVNYPQQCLESWWYVVARYGKPQVIDYNDRLATIKTCMISNYVYRVYKSLMDKGIKITLPPHFYLLKATTEEISNREVIDTDYGLPYNAPMESKWMRVTVPFLPGRDMGILHTNDGKTFTVAEPLIEGKPFRLYFPLKGKHHDTHTTNAFYDYTTPGIHIGYSIPKDKRYLDDGFVMAYTGDYGMKGCPRQDGECYGSCVITQFIIHGRKITCIPYEGHPADDKQARDGRDTVSANWWLQLPSFPGRVEIGSEKNNASGIYTINHNNGYRSVYIHAQCMNKNYRLDSLITWKKMDNMFVKTGNYPLDSNGKGTVAPHMHFEVQRCLSNNPGDWSSKDLGMWVPIDPYGWKGDIVPTNWTRARYSRLWANLSSSGRQSLVGTPISLYGSCDGTIYRVEGQEENLETSELSVYPNPTSQEVMIHVTSTQSSPITIVNSLGVVVGRYTVQGSLAISVADMPVGVYVIQVTVDGKNLYKKLVIAR